MAFIKTFSILALTLAASLAAAQPQITYNTECGDLTAVGRSRVTGATVMMKSPNFRVNAAGDWEQCAGYSRPINETPVPAGQRRPIDCPQQVLPRWPGAVKWCLPRTPHLGAGALLDEQTAVDSTGPVQGSITYRCEIRADGLARWVAKSATCALKR